MDAGKLAVVDKQINAILSELRLKNRYTPENLEINDLLVISMALSEPRQIV